MQVRAYDFDGSIPLQQPLLAAQGVTMTVQSMRHFERSVRLWATPGVFKAMSDALPISSVPTFSLIGSGDYHHVSLALIAQHTKPLTVLLFDNHPDWMRPPHQFHCGSWVYSLARLPHVARVIIVGLESGDVEPKSFSKGDIASFEQGKIVLFPYQPVTVRQSPALTLTSRLQHSVAEGVAEIMEMINTRDVYISVDKDCLRYADARTNWEQGSLPLQTVVTVMRAVAQHKRVVGADSVGDYSLPRFRSPLKWLASRLDRRQDPHEVIAQASRINACANHMLIEALS